MINRSFCRGQTLRIAFGTMIILLLAGSASALSNSGSGNWQYYKDITIGDTGNALIDYQMLVSLDSSNFPTNAQNSGADIRFADGTNELSYWIESWDYAGKSAKIWVKVPNIIAGTSTIRMYYGNPSASSSSNGDATFELFDEFEGASGSPPNSSKWITIKDTYGVAELDGTGRLKIASTDTGGYASNGFSNVYTTNDLSKNVLMEYKWQMGTMWEWYPRFYGYIRASGEPDMGHLPPIAYLSGLSSEAQYPNMAYNMFLGIRYNGGADSNNNQRFIGAMSSTSTNRFSAWDTTNHDSTIPLDSLWHKFQIFVGPYETKYFLDYSTLIYTTAGATGNYQYLNFYTDGAYSDAYFDDIFVRKYASSEPTLTIGAEQPMVGTGAALSLSNSGDGAWNYQRDISIKENSGTTLTDYQVLVELKGADFLSEVQSGGADIRFTDASGNELSYWIESWDYSGRNAKIWVKVSSIPANGETKLKLYYGNANAERVSNGDKTFEFFDDFEDGTLNKLSKIGSPQIGSSYAFSGGYGIRIYGNRVNYIYKAWSQNPTIIEFRAKQNTGQYFWGGVGNLDRIYLVYDIIPSTTVFVRFASLGNNMYGWVSYDGNNWVYVGNTIADDELGSGRVGFGGGSGGDRQNDNRIEYVRVRKYASSEPSVSAGAETPVDNIAPTTAVSLSGTAGSSGWNTSDVQVTLTAADDGGSGVANIEYNLNGADWITYTGPFTISDEGTTTIEYNSTDNAGNVEQTKTQTIKIDKTPPQISINTPADEGKYILNQHVLANWSANDIISGLASATGTNPSGEAIDTATVGTKTFEVTAADNAGNSITKTVSYHIAYNFGGILSPINPDGSSVFRLGSTVPVKFKLTDANSNSVTGAAARIYVAKISEGIVGTEMEANSTSAATTGNLFRYDATDDQYIFNLGTKSQSTGTWKIRIELDDGTSKYATIGLK